jgi:indolepyruvate ferredoxin oxidoreductase
VIDPERTVAVVSTTEVPTSDMVLDTTKQFPSWSRIATTVEASTQRAYFLDAAALAETHLYDEQFANMIMVGAAYQAGALPMTAGAIEHAITLNGTAVDKTSLHSARDAARLRRLPTRRIAPRLRRARPRSQPNPGPAASWHTCCRCGYRS